MKHSILVLFCLGVGGSASATAESMPYAELVKAGMGDATAKTVMGKSVQVALNGKGELGYFSKKSDETTFVCSTGDKALTSNKSVKGLIEGTVVKAQGWDGTTVYHLKECQFLKSETAQPTTAVAGATLASSKAPAKFDFDACANAQNYSNPAMAECMEKKHAVDLRNLPNSKLPSAAWKQVTYKSCQKRLISEGGGGSSLGLEVQQCAYDAELAYAKSH